ncbi:HAD family hydrolase [Flagellimonas sp. DF-77]|uniref:cytidylyltransferase domain-containing protein n=1 Tax=Flagellimonas algarum TaxID=3230298 RepID=UPI0033930CC9
MAVVAFIPVRGGSKSIPFKNIKDFCGKPLVYWTVKAAVDCTRIDRVVVATDSELIKNTVEGFGLEKTEVYERKSENAQDTSSTESVIFEYLEAEGLSDNERFILIQATSPFLSSGDLNKGLDLLSTHDSVLSCVRTKRFFWNEGGAPLNYDYNNRPRRQDFEGLLMENGAFYMNSVGNIIASNNRISGNIGIAEMPEYTAVEIDEEEDWIMAESLMRRFRAPEIKTKRNIKLFLSDVDGVLTDAGMYYSENGDELKKFNTHDGKGFELLRNANIKTGIVTSEETKIVERRANKLKVDFLYQGKAHGGKLEAALAACRELGISLDEVAYIGDDINCYELLSKVGFAACPNNALQRIKAIPGITILSKSGGEGAVREMVGIILD